jgi:hypothetical protein
MASHAVQLGTTGELFLQKAFMERAFPLFPERLNTYFLMMRQDIDL